MNPRISSLRKFVVVFASCVIYFFVYGTVSLSGQLFPAVRERFDVDRQAASLPFILMFTMRNITGPITGYLGNKLGLRRVTVLGCLLASLSVGACFLVEDIFTFTLLWGAFFGTGFGLSALPIGAILQSFFNKSFNRMHGIFMASGCMGSFVLPGITDYFLKTYGTSGAILLLSGLLLHCVPAAMLLKPPETKLRPPKKESNSSTDSKIIKKLQPEIGFDSIGQNVSLKELSDGLHSEENEVSSTKQLKCGVTVEKTRVTSDEIINGGVTFNFPTENKYNETITTANRNSAFKILDSKNIAKIDYSIRKIPLKSTSIVNNLQVFLDPTYMILLFSLCFSSTAFGIISVVMVDACRDKEVMEDVTVLMTFAIADMVGRFLLGYLADLTRALVLYVFSCGSYGLLLIAFPWFRGYYEVVVFFAVLGTLTGGIITLPTGVIKHYICKENLTMAFSSRYFLIGFANLLQPFIIGYFRKSMNSYNGLFYMLGSMSVFGGILSLFVPSAAKNRDRKKHRKESVGKGTS